MIALKFTQSLLKDMKTTPSEHEDVNLLFCWHVNIFKLNNRKHIVFVNDLSRLAIIIDGIRTSQLTLLKEKFLSTLEAYLLSEGIPKELVQLYVSEGSNIVISKTDSRSVLGTMGDVTFLSDKYIDNIERLKFLNKLIYKPIDYEKPIKVFQDAIQSYFSGHSPH